MATLVQATCPGCKNLLHIPSEWLSQPIRCKHCGLVMAMKPPAAPPARVPVPSTPLPANRVAKAPPLPPPAPKAAPPLPPPIYRTPAPPALPPAPAPLAHKVTPPSLPSPRTPTPPSIPIPQRAIAPSAPIAAPVHVSSGDPFASLDPDTERVVALPMRRRGSWWKGPLVFLVLIGIAGGIAAFAWQPISERFKQSDKDNSVAKNDEKPPKPEQFSVDPAKDPKGDPGYQDPFKEKPIIKVVPPDPTKEPDPMKDPPKKPDPVKDPPKKPDPTKDPPKKPDPVKPPVVAGLDFPRRALIISVHDYVYSNPTQVGNAISSVRNLDLALRNGLNIPPSQILHLSDAAKVRTDPYKGTIEQTLTAFLENSRPQDRVIVFFIGHAVEIEGKGYIAPIDGDLTTASSMIELDWVLKRMAECKARQKVLVLDGNRFNPTGGTERPGPGPMSEKMDALLASPPDGVQIWQACIKGEKSYETDGLPVGQFIGSVVFALTPALGKSQSPEDPFPLEKLNERVNDYMKKDLMPLNFVETARLNGKEPEGGSAFDAKAPAPPSPVAVVPPNQGGGAADPALVKAVFADLIVPPVKVAKGNAEARFALLPRFPQANMEAYKADDKPDSELRKAVARARAAIWAVSPQQGAIPPELVGLVEKAKVEAQLKGVDLSKMVDGYKVPTNENQFKAAVEKHQLEIARILGLLQQARDELDDVKKLRGEETKRWQANYDFIKGRVEAQIAYVTEYSSMLGQIRKELPPREPFHTGWVLAATETLSGDGSGKKAAANSQKLFAQVAEENKGTPWELLAKREKFTALGLEWKASK